MTMAKKKSKENREAKPSKVQSDRKSSTKKVAKKRTPKNTKSSANKNKKDLSEHDVFTGDEDFYKLLAESQAADAKKIARNVKSTVKPSRQKHFSVLQKVLAIGIIAITTMLLYVLLGLKTGPINGPTVTSAGQPDAIQQDFNSTPAVIDSRNIAEEQTEGTKPLLSSAQPLSLKVARDFYEQKSYDKAYGVYNQLYTALPISEEKLRDFLQLQMALCLINTKDYEQASQLFVLISESTSPIVRIIANYRLSLLEIQRKRYLKARTRAYKALALIKAVDFDDDWALSFECDCHFLVAECLTRYVLSRSNADSDVPAYLWSDPKISLEPFDNLSESQLRSFLCSGSEYLNKGLLNPKIVRFEGQSLVPRWSVTCYGAPVEEFLAKYAASAEIDIRWSFEEKAGSNLQSDMIRLSPATLYLPTANSQQILLIAAGSTGLLAHLDESFGKQHVTIYYPADYTSVREHIDFLGQHAISLWRKFVLTFNSDNRLGNAHFAMGLLQSKTGMAAESIAEYKLVANRFSQTSLAPYALLHSSRIKSDLRDYRSARDDLKQLIEQYPDTEIYIQGYLSLADVTKLAGLYAEAAQFYCRVYNFGLSHDSKIASAFGAAKCFYQIKAYEEAAVWLNRYIEMAKGDHGNDLYTAYFLMGKTNLALGKYKQASEAFQYAITEQNSREQYVEAVKALVQGHIEQENFIEALDALENTRLVALSEQQSIDMLLLKSEIYRMLGLVDTAIDILHNRAEFVTDNRLRIKITSELAKCYLANGNLEFARNNFSEVLRTAEPGPLAQSAALELANVCLRLEQSAQSISVCSQLLDMEISDQTKQRTLKILAEAYNQQKDYNKAVLALSGQWQ